MTNSPGRMGCNLKHKEVCRIEGFGGWGRVTKIDFIQKKDNNVKTATVNSKLRVIPTPYKAKYIESLQPVSVHHRI